MIDRGELWSFVEFAISGIWASQAIGEQIEGKRHELVVSIEDSDWSWPDTIDCCRSEFLQFVLWELHESTTVMVKLSKDVVLGDTLGKGDAG